MPRNMPPQTSQYHAYLLRLWRADNGGQPAWRFSLESPHDQRYTFTSFEELQAFLRLRMAEADLEQD